VCKRLRSLCLAPELLRSVLASFPYWEGLEATRPRLRALYDFLGTAPASHIQALRIVLLWEVPVEERAEAAALVLDCVTACGLGLRRLQALSVVAQDVEL